MLYRSLLKLMLIADVEQWLAAYRLPMTPSQARDFLDLAHSSSQYLDLFRHYFPTQCERSLERHRGHRLIPLPGSAYSVYEWQFLALVNKHLFPIPEYVFDDPEAENRCFHIPIEPTGLSAIYDDYSDAVCDMDLGWQLLLYLGGQVQREFFEGVFDPPTDRIFELEIEEGQVYPSVIRRACQEQEGPLAYFHLAIALLDHDTGSIFLDATYDMPVENAFWDRETVDALIEQFTESEEIWKNAMIFVRWLEEDVLTHLTEVVTIWNQVIQESRTPLEEET